ncbi:LysR family transcriptional regulator [Xylophilus rhododendri]|uniref:LysR family transcriptional regulator n=1 Tax=Xylophilus rhododendri TaxID=2697032 RepID=A0A857J4P7_9BURK|nr:LysR substrate-binding domain-containing protein [Xylophilus rhododendri]QHI98079.1 LysR family transcriptional regulator [Xylophilus rhododendri]
MKTQAAQLPEELPDLNDMAYFAKVVEYGGFSAAARALGLQTSLLSRRLSALEARLGVRLLQRSTRRIALTDVGHQYLQHCKALMAEAQSAQAVIEATHETPRGLVRMSCPLGFLENGVGRILARYLADWPEVRLQVEASNRRVDVIEEGFDIALRVRRPPLEDSGLVVRTLISGGAILVGSPALLDRCGRPASLEDLERMPSMGFGWVAGRHSWHLVAPDGSTHVHAHTPRLTVDDFTTLRQAALDGVGIVSLPAYVVRQALAEGTLEQVLPQCHLGEGIAHAVFPTRLGLSPAVRLLIDALVEGFATSIRI